MNNIIRFSILVTLFIGTTALAQQKPWQGKFEQLGEMLPTPNEYRTGSGAPGPNYWQQQADYVIHLELDDENQRIKGSETITYTNNSPSSLPYLWVQLDQNRFEKGNMSVRSSVNSIRDTMSTRQMVTYLNVNDFEGGYKIHSITTPDGKPLDYIINATMMRVNLSKPLKKGEQFSFSIAWSYNVYDRMQTWGRGGYEYFPKDDNYIYLITQFFPRMCVYDDYEGWQNKQFLGQGEFALPFGNYKVDITVPADHVVAATGILQNPKEMLSKSAQQRFERAQNSFDKPVIILSEKEAIEREKSRSKNKKTWVFHADNVRDFALASSRKFIWDAQAVKIGDKTSMAMSFYPKEGNPLWEQESTKAVKNTLVTYSKYTIDYPYPVAISVHAANLGMEYPMICFNFGRPREDGTYSDRTKWGMIGVIIHEVGHNFFPMIINSDERQMTWMDEGINTFVQYRTEVENYPDMPNRRGPAKAIVPYMKGNKDIMRPLMTNSEQIIMFGSEQYAKAATALNILRETVMGSEIFDHAFKTYAQRWAFKHPKPADFFRTMEDASAIDLDWFWKGWFYTTDNCDMSIDKVRWFQVNTKNKTLENKNKNVPPRTLSSTGEAEEESQNFENGPQTFNLEETRNRLYGEFRSRLDDKAIISKLADKNFYEVTLKNKGGLVMPVIIEWSYTDGTKEVERLPAEIWRLNENKVTKTFIKDKEVARVVLDPKQETADIETSDNTFPRQQKPSEFEQFKKSQK